MHTPRLSAPVLALAAGVMVLTPAVAMAATGVFTSTTSTPAVSAVNTTAAGPAVQAQANGTGNKAAIYARNTATGLQANALFARSYVGTGEHYGIWGVDSSPLGAGARGESSVGVGVLGIGPGAGVLSVGDSVTLGHLVGIAQDIAGGCTLTVAEGTSTTCRFTTSFPTGVVPRVVVTPTSNPGSTYWVSGVGVGAFTINVATAVTADTTFSYIVVGTLPEAGGSPLSEIARRAATAAHR